MTNVRYFNEFKFNENMVKFPTDNDSVKRDLEISKNVARKRDSTVGNVAADHTGSKKSKADAEWDRCSRYILCFGYNELQKSLLPRRRFSFTKDLPRTIPKRPSVESFFVII